MLGYSLFGVATMLPIPNHRRRKIVGNSSVDFSEAMLGAVCYGRATMFPSQGKCSALQYVGCSEIIFLNAHGRLHLLWTKNHVLYIEQMKEED